MPIRRVCVYCASSRTCDPAYHEDARQLGRVLARAGVEIVYGGGRSGSMGAVADGALSQGGTVTGVLPRFMDDLEWGHPGLSTLNIVEDMRERKHQMLTGSDAVVALPGGTGTLEELFEAVTLKRLGLYTGPIVLVDREDYWSAFTSWMEDLVTRAFINPQHLDMWTVVEGPDMVLQAIEEAPTWSVEARRFAAVGNTGRPPGEG